MQDLPMWMSAMELVHMVYLACSSIPDDEQDGLSLELRNAASRIPGLIARGFGMGTRRDVCECLKRAERKIVELDQRIMIAHGMGYFDEITADGLMAMTDRIGRRLGRAIYQSQHPRLRSHR